MVLMSVQFLNSIFTFKKTVQTGFGCFRFSSHIFNKIFIKLAVIILCCKKCYSLFEFYRIPMQGNTFTKDLDQPLVEPNYFKCYLNIYLLYTGDLLNVFSVLQTYIESMKETLYDPLYREPVEGLIGVDVKCTLSKEDL